MTETVPPLRVDRRLWLGAVVAVAAIAVLLGHAWRFFPFIADDALISLRYAERFIQGLGLTWNDGERVEGYSNLLWILASSALGVLGVDLVFSLRLLGSVCSSLAIVALVASCARRSAFSPFGMLAGSLFFALSGPIAVWAVGGLEQPLLACLLAFGCVLALPLTGDIGAVEPKRFIAPGVLFGLLGVTRPDGLVFGGLAFVALFAVRALSRATLRQALCFGVPAALPFLAQLAFRLAYYREWVPNSALVKLALNRNRALEGLLYLLQASAYLWPLFLLAALTLVSWLVAKRRRRVFFFALLSCGWAVYVMAIGGDIFPGDRHSVPLIVLAALVVAQGLLSLEEYPRPWKVPAAAVVGAALLLHGWLQFRNEANDRAVSERWEFEGQVVGTVLKKAFAADRPLITVDAAGSVGFFSGLPAIDMYGLSDAHIARRQPPNFGRGFIGHELGDGRYALGRKPDIVVFHTGEEHPSSPGDKQLYGLPEFRERYDRIWIQGDDPFRHRGVIWVSRDSPRIGIRRAGTAVRIPALLFAREPGNPAQLGPDNRLVVEVRSSLPPPAREIPLDCGTWQISASAGNAPVTLALAGGNGFTASGVDELVVNVGEPRDFLLAILPATAGVGFLREVEIERIGACATPSQPDSP